MTKRDATKLADIVGYYFGELSADERAAVEEAMSADPAVLREYFALKRHIEADAPVANDRVFQRLEETLFDAPAAPRSPIPIRAVVMAAALAASVAGIWWQLGGHGPFGEPSEGRWVDTASPEPASQSLSLDAKQEQLNMKTRILRAAALASMMTASGWGCVEQEETAAHQPAPAVAGADNRDSQAKSATPEAAHDFEATPFENGQAEFERVRALLSERYYRPLDDDALWGAAVQGMLEHVDPAMAKWNDLLTPSEMSALESDLSGTLVGVGVWIEVDTDTGLAHVRAALPGSPSERGGVEAGDILLKVDGQSCRGLSLADLVGKIRGEPGTEVALTVLRGDELVTTTLEREQIDMPNVESMMLPKDVAMISIDSFNEKTAGTAESALVAMRDKGARSLVIDLRHNRGGSLKHALATADLFLPIGARIVNKLDRASGAQGKAEVSEGEPILGDRNVVVLVDGETSSGAEFLAVALRAAGATLVGERTRGKWSAQWLEKLDNGYGVKLTAALIEGADGQRYEGVGVEPDLIVKNPETLGRGTQQPPPERIQSDAALRTAHELLQRSHER